MFYCTHNHFTDIDMDIGGQKIKEEKRMKLSAPWITYYKKIEALFGKDPEIKVIFDDETVTIRLFVDNEKKAEALTSLLPAVKVFGNVTVKIMVIPADKIGADINLFEAAFKGNPIFEGCVTGSDPVTSSFNYVVFKKEVVQFFNDDLSDVNGNCSTLYQELAKEIFGEKSGIYYCTSVQ